MEVRFGDKIGSGASWYRSFTLAQTPGAPRRTFFLRCEQTEVERNIRDDSGREVVVGGNPVRGRFVARRVSVCRGLPPNADIAVQRTLPDEMKGSETPPLRAAAVAVGLVWPDTGQAYRTGPNGERIDLEIPSWAK